MNEETIISSEASKLAMGATKRLIEWVLVFASA
jgi:hypothetical protein